MNQKKLLRAKRRKRIRAKVTGTDQRPRLAIYKSNTTLYAQMIDDAAGKTLFSGKAEGKNKEAAIALGAKIASQAKEKGLKAIVFDRGGYQYHGAIKAFADAVREGGVQF